ncbi:hypothetical protein ACFLSX_02785 [Calditrichota bacterium]
MNKYKTKIIICLVFSIAMAYLESAVVVYLREIYYPKGFRFPLQQIPSFVLFVEIGREIATIVMLWAIAKLIAKNGREWFAFFVFNFGVWDIWYYIWLKILLNWPESLLTWDILFLIPIPWVAPVLAPILVSIVLISAALIILSLEDSEKPLQFSKFDWWLEIFAGLLIISSFLFQTNVIASNTVPENYPWWLFLIGMVFGIILFAYRISKKSYSSSIRESKSISLKSFTRPAYFLSILNPNR